MSYDYIAGRDATVRYQDKVQTLYDKKDRNLYLKKWRQVFQKTVPNLREGLLPTPDIPAATLPRHCAVLSLTFQLEKPYISKDNSDFDILDNPVRKEWVFKVPEVASSSWKGALRAAVRRLGHGDSDPMAVRLFGRALDNEDDETPPAANGDEPAAAPDPDGEADDIGNAGALSFFPTFFAAEEIAMEVINPHDRRSGKGKNPIYMECVPAEATGVLTVLYLPPPDAAPASLAQDLPLLAEGVIAMLTVYGFGAKTSSGYGLARISGGTLAVNADLRPAGNEQEQGASDEQKLKPYFSAPGVLIDILSGDDGTLISLDEFRERLKSKKKAYGKQETKLYKQAKKWWEEEGGKPAEEPTPKGALTPVAPSWPFQNADGLRRAAADVAAQVRSGGEAQ